MRRIILASQIAIGILFVMKVLFWAIDIETSPPFSSLFLGHPVQANAQPPAASSSAPAKDMADDELQRERDLMAMLQKKQKELEIRENTVKLEEEKLQALKKEILEKIDMLKALDTQLTAKLETEKSQDVKRLKELAKVYEATPPQKAAAMLEKLEAKTAAGITINMKRDRAGLIWGHLNPQKAVEITREITRAMKFPSE